MARMTKYKTKLTGNRRVELIKEFSANYPEWEGFIRSPQDAVDLGKIYIGIHEEPEEYMYMFCLNTKNRVIGIFEISHGTVNSSLVGAREVFQKALLANSVSIILLHNHPSGDPTPSKQDIEVTKRLVEAGNIVGIEVLDHIIIGDRYSSLKEKGYM